MDVENKEVCPVCTLYLRPGITLKSHLNSHPKQKVIDALINLANTTNDKSSTSASSEVAYQPQIVNRPVWNQPVTNFPSIPMPTTNHSFIYQQFMSTSQPPLPSPQPYITIPITLNPSMMCAPYVYQQQQQVFMSSPALPPNVINSKTPPLIQDVCDNQEKQIVSLDDDEGIEVNTSTSILLDNSEATDTSSQEIDDELFKNVEDKDENEVDIIEQEIDDKDENQASSCSVNDYLRIRQDLNKACQTRQDLENFEEEQQEHADISGDFEFFSEENEKFENASDEVLELNGMRLVLCDNNFLGSQVISQVHDFECNNDQPALMSIGVNEYEENLTTQNLQDEDISQQSGTNLSIRADERMPPRGELSGQESNGATGDMVWNRGIQYDSNSGISCDLFARETWNASEGSDCEDRLPRVSPTPYNELDDTPTIISITEAPLNFKCPTCGKGFNCPKERKQHQTEEHNKTTFEKSGNAGINIIGSRVPNKVAIRKLIIKPKKTAQVIKNENNFEDLFNNSQVRESENTDNIFQDNTLMNLEIVENKIEDLKNIDCFECSVCGVTNSDMKALRKHKQVMHGWFHRYRCDTCGEGLKDQKSYMAHLRKHPLECKICGKYFYRRQNMELHMKRHLGIKPFECEFCKKSFLAKQKLLEHRNIHTGEAPIKCNLCNESFRRHSNLVQHRNLHHFNIGKKVKDYICHCGEVLHSKKKLAWHKEIHDTKPKACTKCNEKFVHMASLTRHIRRSHNERFVPEETRSTENVECPICKNIYLKSSLDAHIRRHNGAKGFSCTICNKEFTTKWNLKLHKWVHASRTAKPFKCEHCKAAFVRESDFTAHMNSHKCVRPYTCNHCGAQFIRKSNCQRHVKEHELTKNFTCQICGKAFHRSYYLKDHLRVHSGSRPYACHICGKSSATKSNHNKHVLIHHAKEPVSTEN